MNEIYDLTNRKGINQAIEIFKRYGWILNPIPWLIYKSFSPQVTTEKQVEAALKIIETARMNNAKNLKLKLNNSAALKLGTLLKGFPLNFGLENSGNMEIEINFDEINGENVTILSEALKKYQ
ncbi:MAG: hypothetical protein SNJ71_07085 [Bacteroidales bacterium]